MPYADPDEYRRYAREWMRRKREADREPDREAARAYYARNQEACRERKRVYRLENPDKVRNSHQKWKAKNPTHRRDWEQSPNGRDITRKHAAARRAKLAKVIVEEVLHSVVFERDGYICNLCGIECDPEAGRWAANLPTLDHVIPLARGGRQLLRQRADVVSTVQL